MAVGERNACPGHKFATLYHFYLYHQIQFDSQMPSSVMLAMIKEAVPTTAARLLYAQQWKHLILYYLL